MPTPWKNWVQLPQRRPDDEIEAMFIHPRRLLPQFPCVTASDEVAAQIRNGRAVNLPELSQARQVKVFAGQRELIAIAARIAGTLFHPKIVLPADFRGKAKVTRRGIAPCNVR